MKKHKPSGFTLIELVVVIVILGVLAVTAAPRFLNYQRDAHVSRADAAFASFANAIQLYQAKWLTEGEPTSHVDYGIEDIYPSALGFPMSVNHEPSDPAIGPIRGEDCVAMWNALMQVDLTIRPLTSTILPSDTDIVAWYTANNECTYYYTSGYDADEEFPMLRYSPLTGVIEKAIGRNNA
ncbi:prepilin-type N-terminal cleavage/methylation domain-containing protein [Vibrio coralliilyticus]